MKVSVTLLFLFSLLLFIACDSRIAPNAARNSVQRPTIIAVISDLNSSYGSVHYNETIPKVIKELAIIKPDIVLYAGDMGPGKNEHSLKRIYSGCGKALRRQCLTPFNN